MTSWIKTEVELPKLQGTTSDYVLIYDKNLGPLVGYLCEDKDERYFEVKDHNYKSRHPSNLNITHWRELPFTPLQEELEGKIRRRWVIKLLRKLRFINE